MNSVRCPQCGLVNFVTAESCKRCRASFATAPGGGDAPAEMTYVPEGEGASLFSAKRVTLGAAALVCVGLVLLVYQGVVPSPFGPPDYAKLIRESKPFREPVKVRVNRAPLPPALPSANAGGFPSVPQSAQGGAMGAAYVLEGLGLLRIGTSSHEVVSPFDAPTFKGKEIVWSKRKIEYVSSISLTERGIRESAGWEEFDAPQMQGLGGESLPWWGVPVGSREFVKVVSTRAASWKDGGDGVEVVFAWRWKPNQIGEAYRRDSPVQQSLTGEARRIAESMGARAHAEFEATAQLVRDGGGWKVAAIDYWRGDGTDASYGVPW